MECIVRVGVKGSLGVSQLQPARAFAKSSNTTTTSGLTHGTMINRHIGPRKNAKSTIADRGMCSAKSIDF